MSSSAPYALVTDCVFGFHVCVFVRLAFTYVATSVSAVLSVPLTAPRVLITIGTLNEEEVSEDTSIDSDLNEVTKDTLRVWKIIRAHVSLSSEVDLMKSAMVRLVCVDTQLLCASPIITNLENYHPIHCF